MKTKIEKNKRGRLNAVDILIIMALILIAFVTVYLMFFSDVDLFGVSNKSTDEVLIAYTLEISPVDDRCLTDATMIPIRVGDALYNLNSKYMLGTVVSLGDRRVYRKPIGSSATGEEEGLVYAEYPGYSAFTVVVQASAQLIDGVYYVEGHALRIGESFEFTTPYFTGTCHCHLVEEV